jgi:hypothetical protein
MSEISNSCRSDCQSSEFSQTPTPESDFGWEITNSEFDQKLAKQRIGLIQIVNQQINLSLILAKYQVNLEPILGNDGWTQQCCCPFPDHPERTPSFYFNSEKGLFNCFGCHRGGKAVEFIAAYEGIGRYAAAEKLSSGLNLQEIQIKIQDKRVEILQEKLLELANLSRSIYQSNNLKSDSLEKIFEVLDFHLREFEYTNHESYTSFISVLEILHNKLMEI